MSPFQLHQLRYIRTTKKKRKGHPYSALNWIASHFFSLNISSFQTFVCTSSSSSHRWRNITIHRNKLISCWYKPIFGKFLLIYFNHNLELISFWRTVFVCSPRYRTKWSVWKMWEWKICARTNIWFFRNSMIENCWNCSKSNWNHFYSGPIVVFGQFSCEEN